VNAYHASALAWVLAGWAVAAGWSLWERWRGEQSISRALERLHPRNIGSRVLESALIVAVTGLIGPLMLVAWWYMRRQHMAELRVRQELRERSGQEGPIPLVRADTLVAQTTIEAVEAQWRITDPLGGAPEVPFGHLNAQWQALIGAMQDGDELWRIEVERGHSRNSDRVGGYAVIRKGEVVSGWMCERLQAVQLQN
jgi:hypothetical protein